MELSVIIPVMNEQDNIKLLIESIQKELKDIDYELILVDDGSSDETVKRVLEYKDSKTTLIELNRNYGQSTAMQAGIDEAKGNLIALLDGDLQNDPSDIPMMINKIKTEGWDLVAGRRLKRKDGFFLRKIPSKIANMLIRKLSGVHISDYGCTLKVFKKEVAKNLGLYGELHRFIPILAKVYGAKITEVNVKHHPRMFGESKYGINRTLKVFSDLMLMIFFQKYSQKPMHLFGGMGSILFIIGFLINFYLLVLKIFGESIAERPLLTVGVISILAGIQLITTGFLAEYIMRTYFESQNKKTYIIKEKH